MALVAVLEGPGMTASQYDGLVQSLEAAGLGNPDGRLYHVSAATDGGWIVVDVWESEEQMRRFAAGLKQLERDMDVPGLQGRIYPVHNIMTP